MLTGTIGAPLRLLEQSGTENVTLNQEIAAFSDSQPDALAGYQTQIEWGDGAITGGTVNLHDGLYYVFGNHQYTRPGVFSVKVTLWDGPIGVPTTSSANSTGGPLTITPVNDVPTAAGETLGDVYEDSGPHSFQFAGLLANDRAGPAGESDEDAQTITISAINSTVGGTAVLQGGNIVFTPSLDYSGAASFTYTVRDDGADNGTPNPLTATATATFRVREVNDAPTAAADALSAVAEDSGQRTIAKSLLLANDAAGPANEGDQHLDITAVGNAVGGTVSISGTTVRFTPDANFNGLASFSYTVTDDGRTDAANDFRSGTSTAFFQVTPVNDPPRAIDDDLTAITGAAPRTIAFGTLTNNDLPGPGDESNQTLSVTAITEVVGGTVAMTATSVVFTATPGFVGTASFKYTATDNGVTGSLPDPRSALAVVRFGVVPLPAITSAAYAFQTASPGVVLGYAAGSTIDATGITLTRDTPTPGGTVAPTVFAFDPQARTVKAVYNGAGPGGALPDGTYHLTVSPLAVTNARGDTLSAPYRYDFHVLAGDANRDRAVNFSDLLVLAQNYGQSMRTFSQGDFDYDGNVNFADLLILAQRYGTMFAAGAAARILAPAGRADHNDAADRVARDVLA